MTKPDKQKNSLEVFREKWQRQLVQHKNIPAGVLKVALVIGWHINRYSRIAFPGMRTISRLANISTSTVNAAIKWLANNGYLHVDPGRNRANRYRPLLRNASEAPADRTGCSPQTEHRCSPQTTTEPPNLTSDLTSILTASIGIEAESLEGRRGERGNRERGETSLSAVPLSLSAECYRLAREYEGELGASRVAQALRWDGCESEVLERIRETIADGGDLGTDLAEFWISSWKTWRAG